MNPSDTPGAPRLDEPAAGRLTVGYAPDADTPPEENPPRFTWLPALDEGTRYALEVSDDKRFESAGTRRFTGIELNFHTPDAPLAPGTLYWRYAEWSAGIRGDDGEPLTAWSSVRTFELPEGLPLTPLPDRASRYARTTPAHPRLWLTPETLATFRDAIGADPAHCGWQDFLAGSARPWLERDIMTEPAPYPDGKRTAPIWRRTYIECQELLYAIRHLAIAGRVLDDRETLDAAKVRLIEAASWDPKGTTSRGYTDEWAFRVVLALGWGYDWLHDELSDDERGVVRAALLERTREVAVHVMEHARIQLFPYDSHAVRSVSSVLVPCCLAMLHEEPEAREWLDFSIEFLWTVYSPWGDADGGWAEGAHYWMTGMAYLIDAANLLRSATGLDLYARPFFRNTGDFPLYVKAPDTRRGTFGDDATLGDATCLKMGYNVRQFAGVTGNGAYQWYFEEICRRAAGTEGEFYNWGWWDLAFDDMVYRHDFPEVDAVPPKDIEPLRHFRGVGWAAVQVREDDPDEHLQLVFKSSPFGSISHSHADQNAFLLSAYGEDLAIQPGYYVAFNSSMHVKFRRQTRSKNALLIDGQGQYAGMDKARQMRATGRIVVAEAHDDHVHLRGDATAAYAEADPRITSVVRDLYCVGEEYLVIVDAVDATEPVTVDWLLHAHAPMRLGKSSARHEGARAGFYAQCVWSENGMPELSQETGFPGVDAADHGDLPVSTCLGMRFAAARRHRIATVLVPYPVKEPRRVFHFMDDQGYDCNLYFTDRHERSFKAVVQKLAKA